MLFRLGFQLSTLTARVCRLVAESRDLVLLLVALSTKPNDLPLDLRPVLRHKLKSMRPSRREEE
jgi:hypothetical protein